MRAGRAKIDITPAAGTPMDGYYVRSEPSIGVHDPLYCRAVVLDDGSKTLAIASCDLCWVTYPVVTEVRRQAALVGIDHVFISATHSHSGPAIADFLAPATRAGSDYLRGLPGLIVSAIREAYGNTEPCSLALTRNSSRISVNRRSATKETDPEVVSMMFEGSKGQPIAAMADYGCHPTVLGPENLLISADYPGCTSTMVEDHFGDGFVCVFLNGALGDVNPRTCRGYNCHGDFSDVLGVSTELSDSILHPTTEGPIEDTSGLRLASQVIGPLEPNGLRFEVEAMGLGDFVLLGVPAEVFASTGIWLKSRLKGANLMLTSCSNGYCGYIPAPDAFLRGDDEAKFVCWVDSDAESKLRTSCVTLVESVAK